MGSYKRRAKSRGVLPYIYLIGMYLPKGYGFCAVLVSKRV